MTTYLVTGGAGFIGSHVVEHLVGLGIRVVNLDALTYAGSPENLKACDQNPLHVFVRGRIEDRVLVDGLLAKWRPEAIINVAAETHVDRSIDDPSPFVTTNIVGTFQLLEAARSYVASLSSAERKSFRYLQVSTDEVYGSVSEGYAEEDWPFRPNSPYAASKASADHLVASYFKTFGLPTLTTQGANTYGPRQFPEKLIPLQILMAVRKRDLPVYGVGENRRDWLHVKDHCTAIFHVLKHGVPGDRYNISGANECRNIDVVRTLCALLDKIQPRADGSSYAKQITFVTDRPGHDFRYALSGAKLGALGWLRSVDFEAGLRSVVEWYLANPNWVQSITSAKYDLRRLGSLEVEATR